MPPKRKSTFSRASSKAKRNRKKREDETLEAGESRREGNRERSASARRAETPEEKQTRLEVNRQRWASARRAETPEQKQTRLEAHRQRYAKANKKPTVGHWQGEGFHYNPNTMYASQIEVAIGEMAVECQHCSALKWQREAHGLCCNNGKVDIDRLENTPQELKTLLTDESDDAKHFRKNIQLYNTAFQMTSFGAQVIRETNYHPSFKIQGQVYHCIGSLLPKDGEQHKFLQVYFMGDSHSEADRRKSIASSTKPTIIHSLQDMLHRNNRLVSIFKNNLQKLQNNPQPQNHKVVIRPDKAPPGEHRGRHNAPRSSTEVAVVIVDRSAEPASRDIILEHKSKALRRVSEIHPFYDSLQYPLLFPYGEEGYSIDVPVAGNNNTQKTVSAMAFYAFRLMDRKGNFNRLLRCDRLLMQYLVDMYAKVETERLNWIRANQTTLRVDCYEHMKDAVDRQTAQNDAPVSAANIGKVVILPSSFTGGPRYMHERIQDAMTYVRKKGKPDLFITFTTNPQWSEITDTLMPGQRYDQRPDLTARVFHLKLIKLQDLLKTGQIFGPTICGMHTVEWQKRGLPHAHILVWLKQKLRSTDTDQVISAEFPDPLKDPQLFQTIKENMVHGPCGALNPKSVCMERGRCKQRYPRQLCLETQTADDGYPLYRRRSPDDGGFTAKKKLLGAEVELDNGWVVPHSPLLCKIFNAHINVEVCNSVKSIKYICKYVNKGSDQAVIEVARETASTSRDTEPRDFDEVKQFQSGRYISSTEAAWKLFDFPIHERYPTVQHLSVHLENGQRVYFNDANVMNRSAHPPPTTLTAFFELCQRDDFAKTLLYCDVPQYYTWSKGSWQKRKRGAVVSGQPDVKSSDALGRVYTVHRVNDECFFLRLLLHEVKGPTSFDDLKTVDGQMCDSFKEACRLRGLLDDDIHWDKTLEEASVTRCASMLRHLMAIMIVTCNLSDPLQLWTNHKESLSEDILLQVRRQSLQHEVPYTDVIFNQALVCLDDKVMELGGKSLDYYGLPAPQRDVPLQLSRHMLRETGYNTKETQHYVAVHEPLLTREQQEVYSRILESLDHSRGEVFFLDAPGGTGKTFLINLILSKVRSSGKIALGVASSGIAATLLSGGRTAHSTFKLPLDLDHTENPTCNISKGTDEACVLEQCQLIIWDECTMAHKHALEALDKTLKDIKGNKRLLGGVTLLLSGDFRQTLPVVPRGTPADELKACLKASYIWPHVKTLTLTENMRVRLHGDESAGEFASMLLKIGNGEVPVDKDNNVSVTEFSCKVSEAELITSVYPQLATNSKKSEWLRERAILAPKNIAVQKLNEKMLGSLPGSPHSFKALDTVEPEVETLYPTEFLHSLDPPGLPSYNLLLKVGCPVMLLRNLDPPTLCNGTRLIVKQLNPHVITATIITGQAKGKDVFIPRIPLIPSSYPIDFKRLQFPLRPCFAMTINKAQGQSLEVVGLFLQDPCFSHGQLYVGSSRVGTMTNLFVHAPEGKTRNVVYPAALK